MLLLGLSGVVYTFADAILKVTLQVITEGGYVLVVSQVSEDWGLPVFSVILYYLLRTVVQSFSEGDDLGSGNRFWGV